ncbi:MAG: phosphotransferase family protein [Nocardioides sp.]|uniref:phosphotransferase family protein n=1 Tax=Nocardioides sp. TaxID=35761 RepID=UPI003F0CF391
MSLDAAARSALWAFGYAGADVEDLQRLPQGIKNVNYRVGAGGRDWVLKRHSPDAVLRLARSQALESRLAEAGLPVPRWQRSSAGDSHVATAEGIFTLHEWVHGHQISIAERDGALASHPQLVGELGTLVGDLHREADGLLDPHTPAPDVEFLMSGPRRTVASIRHGAPHRFRKVLRLRVRRSRSELDTWIVASLPGLFNQAMALSNPEIVSRVEASDTVYAHNDVNWENVVLGPRFELRGLLDFDNAAAMPRWLDVGAVAAVLIGAHEERLQRFLDAYVQAAGVEVDREVVRVGMRWKCLRSILWSVDAYLSGRVADAEMVWTWCRSLEECLKGLPES